MLTLKSKTLKVYKNNKLNSASFGDFTHCDYQVFLHLISKLGGADEKGKYLQPKQLQRKHVLTAKDYAEMFNCPQPHAYKMIKKACDKLMKTDIKIEKIESGSIWRVNVCSSAEYIKKSGRITIEFTDTIMPYLAQVQEKFLIYNLKEVANFGSIYTTRLYELIRKFKHAGWMEKSLEELRDMLAMGDKYKQYYDFKLRAIIHTCKEINKNYPKLNLKFEEKKEGRKVVALKFTFEKEKKPLEKLTPADTKLALVEVDTAKTKQKPSKEATELKNHISELSGFLGTILCQRDPEVKLQTQDQLRQVQKKLSKLTSSLQKHMI